MKIMNWMRDAYPGDTLVYHSGASLDDGAGGKVPEAQAAWRLAVEGRVTLFQRRVKDHAFDYIAMRVTPQMGTALAPTE